MIGPFSDQLLLPNTLVRYLDGVRVPVVIPSTVAFFIREPR